MNGRSARGIALAVAAIFAAFGVAWVLLSDILLYRLTSDPVLIARLETAKGWIFVAIATALLYVATLRSARRLASAYAALSAVVDSIADGVLLFGADRAIMRANPTAAKMLNCTELVGMDADVFAKRFRVSRPDGSLVRPEEFISRRVFDEGGALQVKVVLHPPGAEEIVTSATAAAAGLGRDATVDLVVTVLHDITDTERFERLRDQFFAAAAHTLKTPVAIIRANTQTLSSDDAAVIERSSAAIDRQCLRIDRLVQNLLVLARLRTQTLQLYPEAFELAPLVERVSDEMGGAFPSHDVRSVIEATPHVYGDRERLSLALSNLIDEAVRSSAGPSTVTVRLAERDENALIGVSYPSSDSPSASAADGERQIARLVARKIVDAHAGSLETVRAGTLAVSWISLARMTAADAPR